ncbi:glycosyltransferase [Erwinia persicina]|nr:glycosyltransferase [Erwinia persicina]
MFSVLMSLYDKEKAIHLDQCLSSLYTQTLKADEIILVYDGYINKELDDVVLRWMELLPLKLVKLVSNVGLGKALNIGLEQCKNDIVARMDTDDLCDSKRFELQIPMMSDDPELAIVGSYINEFDNDPVYPKSTRIVPLDDIEIKEGVKLKSPFNHMTVVFRKTKVKDVGGYQHLYLMEDYSLWLRLLKSEVKAKNIPLPLVNMRAGRDMLLRRRGFKYVKSEYKIALLKRHLGYQNFLSAMVIFFARATPRLMPVFLFKLIYSLLRK